MLPRACFVLSVAVVAIVLSFPSHVCLGQGEGTSNSSNANASQVAINFDTLATNAIVPSNQYQIVSFSTDYQYGANVYTIYDGGVGGSYPNGIESVFKYYSYIYNQPLYVNFAMPVNGLTFKVLNGSRPSDISSGYAKCLVDVYVNNSYYGTYSIYQNAGAFAPIPVNVLSGISHITAIGLRYYFNCESYYCNFEYPLIYDDFTFTPELSVNIINPRANGGLDQTTQTALVGARITLQASTSRSGGTYVWSFTGPQYSITDGSPNSSSITIRPTDTGTISATLTYNLNGISVSPIVNINVIVPTLTSFWGTKSADQLNRNLQCSNQSSGVTYTLGCYTGAAEEGIVWTANAQIPSVTYLSDPAESGIKFVQAVSVYRQRLREGNIQCWTARSPQSTGWQLDSPDPYNHSDIGHPPRYFSDGNTLQMSDFDAPGSLLEGTINGLFFSDDARFISDDFETYVFYFTTDPVNHDSAHPIFQRPIGLDGSSLPYARLAWSWGGTALFNYFSTPPSLLYTLQSNTVTGQVSATPTATIKSMATNANTNAWDTCPGTTATSNPIDGSRFYVTQLYLDFLNRLPDTNGLNYWRYNITFCGFDSNCIDGKRVDVARAFFYCPEFIGAHPELGGPRGNHNYNSAFIYWCYRTFLAREPNAPPDVNWDGFNYWVGVLDSTNPDASDGVYNHIIRAFLVCPEYRARFGPP